MSRKFFKIRHPLKEISMEYKNFTVWSNRESYYLRKLLPLNYVLILQFEEVDSETDYSGIE